MSELHLETHTHTPVISLYLTLTFISSQTQGNKWSRSKLTSQCVFLWKRKPINLKPCTRFTCLFHYFSSRLVKLPWTNPLCPFLQGTPFYSECWVMFGHSVCWSCTLRPHSALRKARGPSGWAAESDRWPGPRAPKYSGTTPVLLLRWYTESGPSMLDCDVPQHSLVVFALRPKQINTTSYTNSLAGAGKAHARPGTKGGRLSIEGLLELMLQHCFQRELKRSKK